MGCGRSKFHSQKEPETNGKSKAIESDNKNNTDTSIKSTEFENAKFRMRRCTPAVNTNGSLQADFDFSTQDRALEKFNSKPFNSKNIHSPQVLRVTNSQLEFFKMLDEKIEQGSCSSDEDEVISYKEQKFAAQIQSS